MISGRAMLRPTSVRKLAIVLPVCCLIAGCRSGSDEAATDMPPQGYQPFDVVSLHPEAGDGDLTGVGGARILADRSIQILVEGGACQLPTKLDTKEGPAAVEVKAYAHDAGGEQGCTMQIVPWFVPIAIPGGLGERDLVDGSTGQGVRVADCELDPSDPWCGHRER